MPSTQADPGLLGVVRNDWTLAEAAALHRLPSSDLLFHAQRVHRRHFDPNIVQQSALLSIKTGACPEDCAYCPQSVHAPSGREATARPGAARAAGSSRRSRRSRR